MVTNRPEARPSGALRGPKRVRGTLGCELFTCGEIKVRDYIAEGGSTLPKKQAPGDTGFNGRRLRIFARLNKYPEYLHPFYPNSTIGEL